MSAARAVNSTTRMMNILEARNISTSFGKSQGRGKSAA